MIDLSLLREETFKIKSLILKKEPNLNVDELLNLDKEVRTLKTLVENYRKERNEISKEASFKVTEGFVQQFGKERVRNTALCESAIIGTGLGLSIKNFKSVMRK